MPITKDGNGVIQYTAPEAERLFQETGVAHDSDFAIADKDNILKQVKWNIIPLDGNPGVQTVNIQVGANATTTVVSLPAPVAEYLVDPNRTDNYTADGSLAYPYKLVMDAVAKIIANGDNSADKEYIIRIKGPCVMTENITLNDLKLVNLSLFGEGGPEDVNFIPVSGDCISSTTNNSNLNQLRLTNLVFYSPVVLTSTVNGGSFGAIIWSLDSEFSGLTAKNLRALYCINSSHYDNVVLENIDQLQLIGNRDIGTTPSLDVTFNGAHPKPSGQTASGVVFQSSIWPGAYTAGANTTTAIVDSFLSSTVSNAGTMTLRNGGFISSNLTNTGTMVRDIDLGQFKSFVSTLQTANGSAQSLAHGLGYLPTRVLVSIQDNNSTNFVITEGTHTTTNVVVTVTSGAKYKVMAF